MITPKPVPRAVRLLTAISLFWRRSKRDIRNYIYCDAPRRLSAILQNRYARRSSVA